LNVYPPDFEYQSQNNLVDDLFYTDPNKELKAQTEKNHPEHLDIPSEEKIKGTFEDSEPVSIEINTELGLIQQYYAYDQKGANPADINIYMTITISKTFIIGIDFSDYPKKPRITLPEQLKHILGSPYDSLTTLKKWKSKRPAHIVDILHELEKRLFFIADIEREAKTIFSEFKCDTIEKSMTKLKVHVVTYGFREYPIEFDLMPYPKPPNIILSSEAQNIIQTPITALSSYENWIEKESKPIDIIREIAWLIDKNSRINFEIELLKEHYTDLRYDEMSQTLGLNMKGKMRTQDITFEFQINLPEEYPMKMPDIKVLNEFEIETQEKIKTDLQSSFNDFFNEWTPYSYLVDLFNLISEKIFEVSVVACVICHKIECPTCSLKIAGAGESCHIECPHCDRIYHKHCWDQTIKSFGKCGFCLKVPPPEMIP
jgi:ubiquitin-protein ligase